MGGVERAKHNMCSHRHRQVRERLERRKIGPHQLIPRRINGRQTAMGIRGRPTVTGNVLEDRQHAAVRQSVGNRPRDGRHLGRLGSVGAIADHRIRPGHRHVGERQAIHGNAELGQIRGDQTGAEPGRPQPKGRIEVVEGTKHRTGRIDRPVRRAEPLHPAALLIDQDRSVGTTCCRAQFANQ